MPAKIHLYLSICAGKIVQLPSKPQFVAGTQAGGHVIATRVTAVTLHIQSHGSVLLLHSSDHLCDMMLS